MPGAGVRVEAGREQFPHRLQHALLCGQAEGFGLLVRIGASLQQEAHYFRLAIQDRTRERAAVVTVRGVDIGARVEQQLGDAEIAAVRSDLQRRVPTAGGRIDVGSVRDQQLCDL